AEHAVQSDPSEAQAWTALGNAHLYLCINQTRQDGSGEESCNRAISDFARALAIESGNPRANTGMGNAHRYRAESLYRTGGDPTSEYEAALRSYTVAARTSPQDLSACTNRLEVHASLAEYQAAVGLDPLDNLNKAREIGQQCLLIDRNYYLVHEHL